MKKKTHVTISIISVILDLFVTSQNREVGGDRQETTNSEISWSINCEIEKNPFLGGNVQGKNRTVWVGDMQDILQRYKNYLCGEYPSKHTRDAYYSHTKQFLKIVKSDITPETIDTYKTEINIKYSDRNTRNIKIIAVNQFFKWIQREDLLMKEQGWDYKQKPTLKDKDIDFLLKQSKHNPEIQLILLLLWEGCLRPETIINLKITDKIENKLYLLNTKTGSQSHVISQNLIDAWNTYLKVRPTPTPKYKKYLLLNNNQRNGKGNKYETINPIIRTIARLGKDCSLSIPITPYTIRRTSGTLRQDKFSKYYAGDPKLVMKMFNHKDIRTTLKYDQRSDYDIENYLESIYKPKTTNYKHENDEESNDKQAL